MNKNKVIENLNKLLAYEYAGMIQYQQHAFLVTGLWRAAYKGFFEESSDENKAHARLLGEKIVALGGLPTVEPISVNQSTDLEEMLKMDLELEREALKTLLETLKLASDNAPLRTLLEDQSLDEQTHVEELEKMLGQVRVPVKQKQVKLKRAG